MKKLLTLSTLLLFSLLAAAQTCKPDIDSSRIIVGLSRKPSPAVYSGLADARQDLRQHQIALIAGKDTVSTYFLIYNTAHQVVASGWFSKEKAGEYDLVSVGEKPENCSIVFTTTPLIALSPSHKSIRP